MAVSMQSTCALKGASQWLTQTGVEVHPTSVFSGQHLHIWHLHVNSIRLEAHANRLTQRYDKNNFCLHHIIPVYEMLQSRHPQLCALHLDHSRLLIACLDRHIPSGACTVTPASRLTPGPATHPTQLSWKHADYTSRHTSRCQSSMLLLSRRKYQSCCTV